MTDHSLIDLLQRWIAVPSVNPELTADPEIGGEARYARVLAAELAARGFRVEWHELTPGRPNFIARIGPDTPRRTLLIEAHLDTQGIDGMTVDPFGGAIREGRLYGRGACDQKGPTAAAVHALAPDVLRDLVDAGVALLFVGAMGEERGNIGAEQLVSLGIGAEEALILEPTDLHVVHAHKGAFWFEVTVRGIAAHGSNPRIGCNAIEGIAQVLPIVKAQLERAAALHRHPLLGEPTANFGVVRGGTSINIVPDHCSLQVDRRLVPGEDPDEILRELRAGLEDLQARRAIAGYDVCVIKDGRPFATAGDSPLVTRLLRASRAAGVAARAEGAAWFSDAGPFARTCPAVAVFGPGSILQAHTCDEYIEVESLCRGAVILRDFLRTLAAETRGAAG